MHHVLARQMRRFGLSLDTPPTEVPAWKQFLERVQGYYEDADKIRYRLERSLRLSSDELLQANRELTDLARARLARSEAHYDGLFQHSPVPTWEEDFSGAKARLEEIRRRGVIDIEAHLRANPDALEEIITSVVVTDVNPAVARLVGTTDHQGLIGAVTPSLITAENTAAWIAQLKALWNGDGLLRIDHLVGERVNGEVFHGILEWHPPLVNGEYDYSKVVVSIIDISERIQAEEQMASILKSKDEFLASISHELRTPLTSVLGFAEVLRSMEHSPDDEVGGLLEIIASQASDLANIVDDLLVAARAELGQLSVVSVPIDIHAQLAQVVEARNGSAAKIECPDRPDHPVSAIGDPERVRQILRNLITNADRYGGEHITVEVADRPHEVAIAVCDDGPGLSGEQVERVFERYYRAPGDGGQPGSVGIGLTISRELARMMDGELWYQHDDGQSRFTLELPKA